jgi:D-arabinose 1-dehydrogenase
VTGYPLATLLRIAILILHSPPYKPVDVLLTYSHLTLQNSTFLEFAPHFRERAKVGELVNASPFSMGLLALNCPARHPAPPDLREAASRAGRVCKLHLANVAAGYAIVQSTRHKLPLVAGFSKLSEVHEFMEAWRDVQSGSNEDRLEDEKQAIAVFKQSGYFDWSW